MKRYFQGSNRMYCLTNICVCLLCSSYLMTSYCKEDNDVQKELNAMVVDKDLDPLSQQDEIEKQQTVKEQTDNIPEKKATIKKVVTASKKTTSGKKYVKPKYDAVTGSAVVDYAKKYIGLRYVSGGNSLTTGTDCSGFTKLIYKQFGITLSRSVKSQVTNGTYVKKSDLQKGDLIFYGYRKGVVSHVAIYIGNGKVIHQSTPKSGVKINSMNMMVYITARRVIAKPASTLSTNTSKSESSVTINDKTENVNNENINTNNSTNISTNDNQKPDNNVGGNNTLTYTNNEYGK